jgi:D-glycero-D-manno-heptose 1,7-bisphosphate phosphatase
MTKKRAVFLDRDGVLNIPIIKKKKSYAPLKFHDFKLYPNLDFYCKKLKLYFLIIVVTNQPDIKRKKIKNNDLTKMHEKLKNKINYDDLFYCTDISKKSFYKKPNLGMFLKAIKKYNIDPKKSYLIGDRWSDIEPGNKLGCKTIFIDRKYDEKQPKNIFMKVKSFSEAARIILNDQS